MIEHPNRARWLLLGAYAAVGLLAFLVAAGAIGDLPAGDSRGWPRFWDSAGLGAVSGGALWGFGIYRATRGHELGSGARRWAVALMPLLALVGFVALRLFARTTAAQIAAYGFFSAFSLVSCVGQSLEWGARRSGL